ncbi:MAG: sulfatase-like hydrolase/transferase [Bdellovibrionota bacterium]
MTRLNYIAQSAVTALRKNSSVALFFVLGAHFVGRLLFFHCQHYTLHLSGIIFTTLLLLIFMISGAASSDRRGLRIASLAGIILVLAYATASDIHWLYFGFPFTRNRFGDAWDFFTGLDGVSELRFIVDWRALLAFCWGAVGSILMPRLARKQRSRSGRAVILCLAGIVLWTACAEHAERADTVLSLVEQPEPAGGLPGKHIPLRALLSEREFIPQELVPLKHPPVPPSVLLIVLESTSAAYLSPFSDASFAVGTPELSALMRSGLSLRMHHSSCGGASINSDWSILTGLYPASRGETATAHVDEIKEKNLFRYFKNAGYRTASFFDGNNRQWEQFKLLENSAVDYHVDGNSLEVLRQKNLGARFPALRALLDQLEKTPGPFFFYFRTEQPHFPYPTPGINETDSYRRYTRAVTQNDALIGKIMRELQSRGRFEDTIVLITGDHGETFPFLHGLQAHSNQVYEELTRVPFVLSYPRLITEPFSVSQPTSHVDIAPTLLSLAGIAIEDQPELDGYNILATLPPNRLIFMTSGVEGTFRAISNGRFKLIIGPAEEETLSDLEANALELGNVPAYEHGSVLNQLRSADGIWQEHRRRGVGSSRLLSSSAVQVGPQAP